MTFADRLRVLWRLTRPFTLTASLVPVLTGIALAAARGAVRPGPAAAFLVAAMLIQAATNMFNEYFDYRRGLDTHEMVGIAGAIVRDGVSPRTVLALGWTFAGTAVALGLYISASSSWWVFATGLACIGVAYLYSAGPVPLAYTPFGELVAGIMMGPVIVLLSYFVQAGELSGVALWVSTPIGLLIGSILTANNLRDLDQDAKGGRRTLAILLGRAGANRLQAGVFVAAYLVVIILAALRWVSPWTLLVLLAAPLGVKAAQGFFRHDRPADLVPAFKATSIQLLAFGTLLVTGLLLG
ncbi:MAG: 1,4-dihydroxy-2-naphthodate octaprenyltransferase [Symbiobacteriaceae bacterium]|jgi:1,4-dihydroxy-2-naphthoate octaprenyltransferase|nr:1,4-dihydroxy-2-naphthodate octaprenyltransferase [Symbiobacteriaceae bacterium]